jgi:hypothetical protein
MSKWSNIVKNNINKSETEKKETKPKVEVNINQKSDIKLVQNKYIESISEIYFDTLDKINNGCFTILTVKHQYMCNDFCNMILKNINYKYHIRHDNLNSDSDIVDYNYSDEDEFIPTYSKFAYT